MFSGPSETMETSWAWVCSLHLPGLLNNTSSCYFTISACGMWIQKCFTLGTCNWNFCKGLLRFPFVHNVLVLFSPFLSFPFLSFADPVSLMVLDQLGSPTDYQRRWVGGVSFKAAIFFFCLPQYSMPDILPSVKAYVWTTFLHESHRALGSGTAPWAATGSHRWPPGSRQET